MSRRSKQQRSRTRIEVLTSLVAPRSLLQMIRQHGWCLGSWHPRTWLSGRYSRHMDESALLPHALRVQMIHTDGHATHGSLSASPPRTKGVALAAALLEKQRLFRNGVVFRGPGVEILHAHEELLL